MLLKNISPSNRELYHPQGVQITVVIETFSPDKPTRARARAPDDISSAINSAPAMIQIQQIDVVDRMAAVEQGWFKASHHTRPHLPQGIRRRMVGRGFATDGLQLV